MACLGWRADLLRPATAHLKFGMLSAYLSATYSAQSLKITDSRFSLFTIQLSLTGHSDPIRSRRTRLRNTRRSKRSFSCFELTHIRPSTSDLDSRKTLEGPEGIAGVVSPSCESRRSEDDEVVHPFLSLGESIHRERVASTATLLRAERLHNVVEKTTRHSLFVLIIN